MKKSELKQLYHGTLEHGSIHYCMETIYPIRTCIVPVLKSCEGEEARA